MQKKLFLLDSMALIFRAYYAMIRSPRMTSAGLNTSAIFGFTNTLYEVLKNEKPTHIAAAIDTGAPTIRHADFDGYKANREETPDDILSSIPYIKRIVAAFGIPMLAMDGYEADDIVGTVAKHAELAGFQVYMMTSDKDYGQLVSDNIYMYKPGKSGQKAEVMGQKEICEQYGLQNPEQFIDILGLWGDSVDNIPGVPNIGLVKAKKLIAQFGSMENLYAHIEEVSNDKMRQTLIDYEEQARMSKNLATIILDVPIQYNWEEMKFGNIHVAELQKIFNELEFKVLGARILSDTEILGTAADNNPPPVSVPATNTPDLFSPIVEPEPSDVNGEMPPFQNFQTKQHHFEAVSEFPLSTPCPLFFNWILNHEKIAGFCFADASTKEETVYYHLLENQHFYYRNLLLKIFEGGNRIITYNCKQTYKFAQLLKIDLKTQFFDLQIAHYLIQPEISHRLEALSENYLRYRMQESDKKQTPTPQTLIEQCAECVEVFRELYPLLSKELNDNNLTKLFEEIEMPLTAVLAKMENNGIHLDTEILTKSSEQLNRELQELEKTIYALAEETFNIGSPRQLGEILFKKLQIVDSPKLTKTKQYQTGEEVLVKLAHRHPIVPMILEWRRLSKLKSTYIDALPMLVNSRTGRIHTTFNQAVTSTGRLSSTNPNLQNIPIRTQRGKDIRKAFTPTAGCVIMAADYSQIELRIVASVSGDTDMINTFKEGKDIHAMTAAKVFNVDIQNVTADMRRTAKTVNFGILYGISAFGLADRLYISQKEARKLIHDYYNHFPRIILYLTDTMDFARKHGYVETLSGRRRYIRDINARNAILRKAAERNAINAPIQGTAADLIKIAMIRIDAEMNRRKLQSKMILQVHDELVFEVPQEELDEMKQMVPEIMNSAMEMSVPLLTDVNWGTSWYDAH